MYYKQVLSKLKLDDLDQKVAAMSGGQKKRLALANALMGLGKACNLN